MSEQNVELARRLYELVPSLLDPAAEVVDRAFRDHVDDRFELHVPPGYPEGEQIFRGREGMNALGATFREAWSEWRFVPERFLDAGEQVVVFARIVALGRESHVPIERETTHLWTIRDGRARSMRIYPNRSEALEAVGLQE